MCSYPQCNKESVITFALVDLCKKHYLEIYNESKLYYDNKLLHRKHYNKIKHISTQNKKLVREEDAYGTDCRSGNCEI